MKKMLRVLIVTLLLLVCSRELVTAASFSSALIRFERMQAGQNPGSVLVQFTTSSESSTESFIQLTIDSRWTSGVHFAANPSSFTSSTADLPSGVQAVPLLSSQASSVSGHTVSFAVNNLSSNTTYGFYIDDGFLLLPSTNTYRIELQTLQNDLTVIDQQNIWVQTVPNDQISINAEVSPSVTNFAVELEVDRTEDEFAQDEVLTFTLEYSSALNYATPLRLEAEWPEGETIDSASYSVTEYVNGSASQAYGSTSASIDLLNRKIIWEIASFPANTTDMVTFQIRTTSEYTGSSVVTFPVRARIVEPAVTSYVEIFKDFQYVPPPSPIATSTPTPTSTASPTPSTTSVVSSGTPTPTPLIGNVEVQKVEIVELTDTQIIFDVTTNIPSSIEVAYGTVQTQLNQDFISLSTTTVHRIVIDNLLSNTNYYFQLRSETGQPLSDIYTFKTVSGPVVKSIVEDGSLFFIYKNMAFFAHSMREVPQFSLLKNTQSEIVIRLSNSTNIVKASVYLQNEQVLGISTEIGKQYSTQQSQLVRTSDNTFTASLQLPKDEGVYLTKIQITDINGAVYEQTIARVYLQTPITIHTKHGQPLEGVTTSIKKYNEQTKIYEEYFPGSFQTSIMSNALGIVDVLFPEGKYQVSFYIPGYKSKTIEFTQKEGQWLTNSIVVMEETDSWFGAMIQRQLHTLDLLGNSLYHYTNEISESKRLFELLLFANIISLIVIGIICLAVLCSVHVWQLPSVLVHTLRMIIFSSASALKIYGQVNNNDSQFPVPFAQVYAVDPNKNRIIQSVKSSLSGSFEMKLPKKIDTIKLIGYKPGYVMEVFPEYSTEIFADHGVKLLLRESQQNMIGKVLVWSRMAMMIFLPIILIGLLIISYIFQWFFIQKYGIGAAAPFLIATTLFAGVFLFLGFLQIKQFQTK